MFLSRRYNPFEDFDRMMGSFMDNDMSDFISTFSTHDDIFLTKEEKLKRSLAQLHGYENKVNHQVKSFENSIEQLRKTKEQIEKQKHELSERISKLTEEKKAQLESHPSQGHASEHMTDNRIYKKVHYKTPDMEIEEQYDSNDPKKCYKIIRKQGEAPQIIEGPQACSITNQTELPKLEPLGEGLDQKFDSLCRFAGKKTPEMRNLVLENKDLTVGNLYDKALQLKLI